MSQQNDKIKNDGNSVAVNTIPNSENDSVVNKANTETASTMLDKQNSTVWSNNVKSQELLVPTIRESMVSKATEFLISERVRNTPVDRRVNFLRSKGLTDQEIQISLQRASAIYYENQNSYAHNAGSPVPTVYYNSQNASDAVQIPFESQTWFRRLFRPIAFAATFVYIGYQIYKKYIEKWLFGVQKSAMEKRLEVVEFSIQRCVVLLEEKNNMSEFSNEHTSRQKELDQIRAELKSIKSLLLNRFQFPPAPSYSSIPQWQLMKNTKPQVDQQKVNNTDTSDSSQQILLNGTNNISLAGSHTSGVTENSIVKDQICIPNDLTSYGTLSPVSSDQNTVNDVVDQSNGDGHNVINGGLNQ